MKSKFGKLNSKIGLICVGLIALVWFLIRVIPKPDRATYPCQRAAFPMASAFVIWINGVLGAKFFFDKARRNFTSANYTLVLLFLIFTIVSYSVVTFSFSSISASNSINSKSVFVPTDSPNSPMGVAKGIFPGRVVWEWDPDATNWDGKSGFYWSDQNINIVEVDKMLSASIRKLTETNTDQAAWDSLFHSFNRQQLKGDVGYSLGQKIAIKINMNNSNGHGNFTSNNQNSNPQMVLALLKQLVDQSGVNETDITFYDISRPVSGSVFKPCLKLYPKVKFVDNKGGDGITKFTTDMNCQVKWSESLILEPGGGYPTYLPTCVTQADYLINLASLKGHTLAGISLCAKNHFGTIVSTSLNAAGPQAAGVHPYATVHDFYDWDFPMRDMATYNILVDLMGHKQLGKKTFLYLVDGLYAAPTQNGAIVSACRWLSAPFNNDWPSSIFVSQDNIAIESVCLDFLRTEMAVSSNMTEVYGNVDNYLHEAAKANKAPSGVVYDPEKDGTTLESIGVHEHWNNATDKQYTRNLGTGTGIELISYKSVLTSIKPVIQVSGFKGYPNPFTESIRIEASIEKPLNLNIYNTSGQLVFNRTMNKSYSWDGTSQSGSMLPKGIYLLKLTDKVSGNLVWTDKVVCKR